MLMEWLSNEQRKISTNILFNYEGKMSMLITDKRDFITFSFGNHNEHIHIYLFIYLFIY